MWTLAGVPPALRFLVWPVSPLRLLHLAVAPGPPRSPQGPLCGRGPGATAELSPGPPGLLPSLTASPRLALAGSSPAGPPLPGPGTRGQHPQGPAAAWGPERLHAGC